MCLRLLTVRWHCATLFKWLLFPVLMWDNLCVLTTLYVNWLQAVCLNYSQSDSTAAMLMWDILISSFDMRLLCPCVDIRCSLLCPCFDVKILCPCWRDTFSDPNIDKRLPVPMLTWHVLCPGRTRSWRPSRPNTLWTPARPCRTTRASRTRQRGTGAPLSLSCFL